AALGVAFLAVLTGWELRHPTLPMTFELAAMGPGARSAARARLPSALVGLAAAGALGLVVARTVSRKAALYAVGVLLTAPIVFVPARVRIGGELAMACGLVQAVGQGARAAQGATFEHALPALAYGLGPWAL